jgi:tetratricopeptide (TPR) repeat protein
MNCTSRTTCFLILAGFVAAACTVTSGCRNSSVAEIEDLETVSLYSQSDQLALTMEYIRGLERYDMDSFRDKVNSGLNRWASSRSEDQFAPSWKLANLAASLPDAVKSTPVFTSLDDDKFYSNDAYYLQQIYWLREIANRVADSNVIFHQEYIYQTARQMADPQTLETWEESDDLLFEALQLIHPELVDGTDTSRVQQLARTIKLFDWTIRNVNLTPTRPWPTAEIIEDEALEPNADTSLFPPLTGTPGPGYTRFTWQILTYARGDFLERARVFAGLCHQIGIPVAVLATQPAEGSSRPCEEWLCGAVIGGQMYLFDPLLGLPVHRHNAASVATLANVLEDPTLLSELDLTIDESVEKIDYRLRADQLTDLIALVVAPAESLSRRMQAAESGLAGDFRLKLTIDADALAEVFLQVEGISEVALWHAPFSTRLFRDKVAEARSIATFDPKVSERIRWLIEQEQYIDDFVQMRTARNCFLRGIFRSDRDRDIRSALSYYYAFMYTDEEISLIERDTLLQRQLGILQEVNQSYAEWMTRIARMKQYMGIVRADAAFFLSLCNYENDMPATALKWLNRIRNYDDDMRWSEYLPYYRGRALESSGKYAEAAEQYGQDESPQKHGSIIRQRWMKRLQDPSSGS